MYSELFQLHADLLKALAHPRRLEIVQLLRDQELCVTDIHRMLDLPQANVSQHLMVLKDAGVVKTRKDGKQVFYQIAHPHFIEASDLLREFLIEKYKDTELADQFTYSMNELVPLVHDPVCGMRLSPKTASFSLQYQEEAYYFCASGCVAIFQKDPHAYLNK